MRGCQRDLPAASQSLPETAANWGSVRIAGQSGLGRQVVEPHFVNMPRQTKFLQRPDAIPVQVDFVPGQAVARGNGVRMMIVVPALAEREERDEKVIGGEIFGCEAAGSPHVGDRIDRPGGMQSDDDAYENSPEQKRQPADRKEDRAQNDVRSVVILGQPDMDFVFARSGT